MNITFHKETNNRFNHAIIKLDIAARMDIIRGSNITLVLDTLSRKHDQLYISIDDNRQTAIRIPFDAVDNIITALQWLKAGDLGKLAIEKEQTE